MNETLNKLYAWFCENRKSIIKDHTNEFVLLNENSIKGYFKTNSDGINFARKNNMLYGTFLVQPCIPEEEDIVVNYNLGLFYA